MKNYTKKQQFLHSLSGSTLKYKRYVGAPIRYAGGKSLAVGHILELIPDDVTTVVSPFIGGGSVEVAIAKELGIPVVGYDIFDILVTFWQHVSHEEKFKSMLKILRSLEPNQETYNNIKEKLKKHWKKEEFIKDESLLAAYYFFNHNLSYGPGFLGWASKMYLDDEKYEKMLKKLEKALNLNINVFNISFDESIPNHKNDFLYLDPPYFLGGKSTMFKGIYPMRNIPVHHNGFNHNKLAELLKEHSGGFILSYNDTPEVRELYKEFKIIEVKWQYTMGQGETRIGKNRANIGLDHIKTSSEILIIGEKKWK